MGHRLTRLYTGTGDTGTTQLADGRRVPKSHPLVVAMGEVDEINSALAVALSHPLPEAVRTALTGVQHRLFEIGAELAMPEYRGCDAGHVDQLEAAIDRINAELPPLKEFILPGGGQGAAACHLARAVCRRGERALVAAQEAGEELNAESVRFVNRLSDLLFAVARRATRDAGADEVQWDHQRPPAGGTGPEG